MGERCSNSDGFTYPYGKFKFNKNTRSNDIKRQIRYTKRSIKNLEKEDYLEEIKYGDDYFRF